MITKESDRERELSRQIDEQGAQLEQWRDRAIAAEAELARLRAEIQTAYGYLWCVNNEPGTPIALYPPEKAAYEARKVLRELLTTEQRRQGINSVLPIVRAAPPAQPAEPVQLTETEIFKAYTTATGKVLPNMGSSRAELVAITRIVERAHGITGEKNDR